MGKSGKEGTTYEVKNKKNGKIYAMKEFKKKKSIKKFKNEIDMQIKAGKLAPTVIDFCETSPPRIVMEKMIMTLPELIKSQYGKLTSKQQKNLIKLSKNMDKKKIYHNDPNPLNIMIDEKGNFRYIDYGMSKYFDKKLKNDNPNLIALKTIFFGGMQGLTTRKIIKKEDINIINEELHKIL